MALFKPKEKTSVDLDPSVTLITDPRMHAKLDDIVARSRSRTDEFHQLHVDAIRYMYGDQIHRKRRTNWDYLVTNRIYADMQQEIAILSSNNPRLEALPVEDSDTDAAKVCGMVLQGQWQAVNMRMKIAQALLDSKLAGQYIFYWRWEPRHHWNSQANRWDGDLCLDVINPEYFGCDPDIELAGDIPTKAKYVVIQRYMDIEEAAWRWPKYKQYLIKTGKLREEDIDQPHWIPGSSGKQPQEQGYTSGTTWVGRELRDMDQQTVQRRLADMIIGSRGAGMESGYEGGENSRMVKVQTIMFRDYSTRGVPAVRQPWQPDPEAPSWENDGFFKREGDPLVYDGTRPIMEDGVAVGYEQYDPNGRPWPQVTLQEAYDQPLYPHGRVVIRLDDHCVVEDKPWPYKTWNVAVGVNYMLPHLWNGLNGVEIVRELQDYVNILNCHFINNVKFFSDPVWMVEEETLVPDKKGGFGRISNAAGAVIKVLAGKSDRIKKIDPSNIPNGLFHLYEVFKTSIQDLQGIHDVGQGKNSSGDQTLGELQMLNRNTRLRIAMQGAILDSVLQQVGEGMAELMQKHLPVDRWVRRVGEDKESIVASMQWSRQLKDTKYDVVMVSASTLPYDEEREIAKYDKALQAVGPAMLAEYLKKLGIPNYQEILTKHEIVGPLTQLMEMAAQMGMGAQELMAALQAQLELLTNMGAPARQESMYDLWSM